MDEGPRVWLDQRGNVVRYEGPPVGPDDDIDPEAEAALLEIVKLLARLTAEEEIEKQRRHASSGKP